MLGWKRFVAAAGAAIVLSSCGGLPDLFQAEGSGPETTAPPVAPAGATVPPTTPAPAGPIYDAAHDARADIAAAVDAARADGRHVLLDFGADWCPDCVALNGMFESEPLRSYLAGNFHVVRVEVGNWDHNVDVSDEYGHAIDKGIPALAVLDSEGEMLVATSGGEFASAASMSPGDVRSFLERWAPQRG